MKILPENITPDPYLGKGTEFIRFFMFIATAVILSILTFVWFTAEEVSTMGNIGSFLGGILGPLFSLLVGVFTFLAFYVQYDANKKIQEQFKVQQFENKYYKMLDLHKANVSEMKTTFYDHKLTGNIDEFSGEISSEEFLREVEGRKLFVGMVPELEACFKVVYKRMELLGLELNQELINQYCYKLFFYGVRSDQIILEGIPKSLHDSVIKLSSVSQQAFYERNKNYRKKKSETDHHFRFYPFEGHESRLGHYYRHLFEMVKLVVDNDKSNNNKKGLFEYGEARQYLKMLRAQLSNAEQLMLYYNYICGQGKEWDKLGKRNNQFFTRYRMIHNIPVGRVKYVDNPRNHFKEFICMECTEEDPLFEWGDEREELGCS